MTAVPTTQREVLVSGSAKGYGAAASTSIHKHVGGVPVATTTTGTDSACTDGTMYLGEIALEAGMRLTGISYLIGSTGGTDKVVVYLYDSAGTVLANSLLTGTTVGTTATFQRVAFTAAYEVPDDGRYYVGVIFNGATAKFRTQAFGDHDAGSVTSTFGTSAAITPPATFTASKAPYAMTY